MLHFLVDQLIKVEILRLADKVLILKRILPLLLQLRSIHCVIWRQYLAHQHQIIALNRLQFLLPEHVSHAVVREYWTVFELSEVVFVPRLANGKLFPFIYLVKPL